MPLGFCPAWASSRPSEVSPNFEPGAVAGPRLIEDWRDYVSTVARRYKFVVNTTSIPMLLETVSLWSDTSGATQQALLGAVYSPMTIYDYAQGAESSPGSSPSTSSVTPSSGANTIERSNTMCGDTGVRRRHGTLGLTMGPRAENEYAVEPVGVATIAPSAERGVTYSPPIDAPNRISR